MKKTLLYILSFLTLSLSAQDGINYQGAATDTNGDELANQNISIRASVLSASASGNLEWEETHTTTTDQFGLFNIVIGQGTNTTNGATATFDDMDWGSSNHYLKIEVDATGGTNYAMIGTTQMMAVPYALYAKNAGVDSSYVDSLVQYYANNSSNGSSGTGGGCDYRFPEGYNGNALTYDLAQGDYTVPTGKNLYITNVHKTSSVDLFIDGIIIGNDIINSSTYSRGSSFWMLEEGQTISCAAGTNQATFNGVLIDKSDNIDIILHTTALGDYTVPSGKKLIITNMFADGSDGILADNVMFISQTISGAGETGLHDPFLFNEGQVISPNSNDITVFNGYLVDDNYFSGCGGNSPSNSNQSLNVSLNGDSLFISDGNFVLVPGISSMNYTKADFSANYTTVTITNPVSFTDLSTASPTSWYWDFGDGNTSTQQNPIHVYNNVGTYTVTLISTDANVSDTVVKTNYINATLEIGGYYQGGIVFYLDGNGGGLICTLQELPNSHQWGCYNTTLSGAGGQNIGDGLQNTIDIVNGCTQSGIAAAECYNLTENGYSDWFLPSKLELEEMQTQMLIIDSASVIYGGVLFSQSGTRYWSSTQVSSSGAWYYNFQSLNWTNNVNKDHAQRVRPIRAF